MNSEIVAYYRHSAEQLKILKKILKKNNLITDEKIINITPKKLVSLVEDVFECDISLQNRKQTTVFGRQAAAFILKNFTRLSLKEIALEIGVQDHSTVLYSIKKCGDLMVTEEWYRNKIEIIQEEIGKYSNFVSK
jgi:chromosomal replication initiation ATPase DnaA